MAFLDDVFPTCVGMNRVWSMLKTARGSVPHVRGDEPLGEQAVLNKEMCSPRAWG